MYRYINKINIVNAKIVRDKTCNEYKQNKLNRLNTHAHAQGNANKLNTCKQAEATANDTRTVGHTASSTPFNKILSIH